MAGSTETYGPGLHVDVLLPPDPAGAPAVLLWHGRGPGERLVMRRFGVSLAEAGIVVVVPDHRPYDPDGGRAVLTASIDWFERRSAVLGADVARHVLVGWSYGARSAAGHLLSGRGRRFSRAVLLAGTFDTTPPTAESSPMSLVETTEERDGSFLVVHGTRDTVNPAEGSVSFHDRLTRAGIRADLLLVDADHSRIAATRWEPSLGMSIPMTEPSPDARRVLEAVVSFVHETDPENG